MGHKVHPKIHRTQVIYTWDSKWFSKNEYATFAQHDILIREYFKKKFRSAHIDSISIERGPKNMTVTVFAAKPGFIIGRGGKGIDDIRKHIERSILKMNCKVRLNIQEVSSPSLSAPVVAVGIVEETEKRIPFRRVMKQAIERVMKSGAKGVKIRMSGRLNGVEIARTEAIAKGKVPLITLRSDVDYGFAEAQTLFGKIGIKVWIYRGEVFGERKDIFDKQESAEKSRPRKRRPSPAADRAPRGERTDA